MRSLVLASLLALAACGSANPDEVASDTAAEDTGSSADTGNGPVLSGLERYCQAYKDCGGTYYATAEDCVQASLNYWGDCPSRRDALDTFGECMADVDCGSYNPDSYNPNSTECAEQWQAVGNSDPC